MVEALIYIAIVLGALIFFAAGYIYCVLTHPYPNGKAKLIHHGLVMASGTIEDMLKMRERMHWIKEWMPT